MPDYEARRRYSVDGHDRVKFVPAKEGKVTKKDVQLARFVTDLLEEEVLPRAPEDLEYEVWTGRAKGFDEGAGAYADGIAYLLPLNTYEGPDTKMQDNQNALLSGHHETGHHILHTGDPAARDRWPETLAEVREEDSIATFKFLDSRARLAALDKGEKGRPIDQRRNLLYGRYAEAGLENAVRFLAAHANINDGNEVSLTMPYRPMLSPKEDARARLQERWGSTPTKADVDWFMENSGIWDANIEEMEENPHDYDATLRFVRDYFRGDFGPK